VSRTKDDRNFFSSALQGLPNPAPAISNRIQYTIGA
jgi:hypothetical protein